MFRITNINFPQLKLPIKIISYFTFGAVRNDVEIQLNQGASIVISKEADFLYPIARERSGAHIPTFECHPNVHLEGYQGNTYEIMILFKCYDKHENTVLFLLNTSILQQ